MENTQVSWQEFVTLLSPDGQQQLIEFVKKARDERGRNWLPEIRRDFPMFSWIVELVSTRNADEAFEEVQHQFSNLPLGLVRGQIVTLHAKLKTEIERKR